MYDLLYPFASALLFVEGVSAVISLLLYVTTRAVRES